MKRLALVALLTLSLILLPIPPFHGLKAQAASHSITLTWTASTSATTYTAGTYSVYRGQAAGAEGTTPVASGISATTWTDTAVTAGIKEFYTVSFCVGAVCSGASNEASAVPPLVPSDLAPPTGLSGSAN